MNTNKNRDLRSGLSITLQDSPVYTKNCFDHWNLLQDSAKYVLTFQALYEGGRLHCIIDQHCEDKNIWEIKTSECSHTSHIRHFLVLSQQNLSCANTPLYQMCLHTVKWVGNEFQYSQGRFIIPSRSTNDKIGQNLRQILYGLFWFLFPIQQSDIMVHMRHWLPQVTRPLHCYHSHVCMIYTHHIVSFTIAETFCWFDRHIWTILLPWPLKLEVITDEEILCTKKKLKWYSLTHFR